MISTRHQQGQAFSGLALLVCAMGATVDATAGSLTLKPLRFLLSADHPISAVTVRNDGDEPTVVQLEAMQWTQHDGKDVYSATTDILATPPIFTVPAHGSQLIRTGLRKKADSSSEESYRVFLQEVPPPATSDFKGLRVALRFGVPVFVAPAAGSGKKPTAAAPLLQWSVQERSGELTIHAANTGPAHALMTELSLMAPGRSEPLAHFTGPLYVLAGQERSWTVKLPATAKFGSSLRIVAKTDAAPIDVDAQIERP